MFLTLELFLHNTSYTMKKITTIALLLLFLLLSVSLTAQDSESKNINAALSIGNGDRVASYFQSDINLSIPGNENIYSKSQAGQLLKSFFSNKNITGFKIDHEGKNRNNDVFKIGSITIDGKSYRVTYFLKQSGDNYRIKELRIEN